MKLYTGYRSTPGRQLAGVPFIPTVGVKDLPERVNWKEKGWLTGVKNQVSSEHLYAHCWSISFTWFTNYRGSVVDAGRSVPQDLWRDSISKKPGN